MRIKYLLMSALCALFLFSCEKTTPENQDPKDNTEKPGDEKPGDEKPGDEKPGEEKPGEEEPVAETILTQEEQKAFLLEVGKELIGQLDLDYWKDAATSVVKFGRMVAGADGDAISEKFVEAGLLHKTSESYPEERYYQPITGSQYVSDYEIIREYEDIIKFSAINGHFKLNGDTWVESGSSSDFLLEGNADGENMRLALNIKDAQNPTLIEESKYVYTTSYPERQGSLCIDYEQREMDELGEYFYPINPVTGEVLQKKFYCWGYDSYRLGMIYDEEHAGQEMNDEYWNARDEYIRAFEAEQQAIRDFRITYPAAKRVDGHHNIVRVCMPSSITGSLTGDKAVADINIALDYQGGQELDLSKDKINLTASVKAGPYEFKDVRLGYLSNSAEVGLTFSNGNTDLITVSVKEEGHSLAPVKEEHTDENSYEDYDADNNPFTVTYTNYHYYNRPFGGDEMEALPSTAEVEADILGKVQLRGNADIKTLLGKVQNMNPDEMTEASCKTLASDFEAGVSVEVFYNGGTQRQARLGFEPVSGSDAAGVQKWTIIPVIRFEDGASYALFDDFFSEANFGELISLGQEWFEKVSEFIDGLIEEEEHTK